MKREKSLVLIMRRLVASSLVVFACLAAARAQTSVFTYQGRLTDGGAPASGNYDLQFKLYDALAGGNLQGSPNTVTKTGVSVTGGVFTVQLDFGAGAFPGADRYLEISVQKPGDPNYYILTPRQRLTSTPYAIRAVTSGTADNALKIQGVDVSASAPAADQVLKYNAGTAKWEPAADANSGGTVTAVTAGTGLSGGTITSSGTLSVNSSVVQNRVSGSCSVGQYIRAINQDGTVVCGTDANGTTGNSYVFAYDFDIGLADRNEEIRVRGNVPFDRPQFRVFEDDYGIVVPHC